MCFWNLNNQRRSKLLRIAHIQVLGARGCKLGSWQSVCHANTEPKFGLTPLPKKPSLTVWAWEASTGRRRQAGPQAHWWAAVPDWQIPGSGRDHYHTQGGEQLRDKCTPASGTDTNTQARKHARAHAHALPHKKVHVHHTHTNSKSKKKMFSFIEKWTCIWILQKNK